MSKSITLQLSPKQSADAELYTSMAARQLGIRREDVALVRVVKRSIDARRSPVKVNLTLEIFVDQEPQPEPIHFDYPDVSNSTEVVVVGSGPAGLFVCLILAKEDSVGIFLAVGKHLGVVFVDIGGSVCQLAKLVKREQVIKMTVCQNYKIEPCALAFYKIGYFLCRRAWIYHRRVSVADKNIAV